MAAGQGPASLPHLGLLEADPVGSSEFPGPLPHLGSILTGYADSPAPFPHLRSLGGLGSQDRRIDAESGTYSVTGQDAGYRRGLVMPAANGFVAIFGQVGLLNKSVQSSGEAAPFPHMATLFTPVYSTRTLTCDPGSYAYSGSSGLLDHEHDADYGTYGIAGQDATLAVGLILTAEAGTYQITGQDADSMRGGAAQVMACDYGAYDVAGQDAGTVLGYVLATEHGFFPLLGQDANLAVGVSGVTTMLAEFGLYEVTGIDADFAIAAEPVPEVPVDAGNAGGYWPAPWLPPKRKKKKREEEAEEVAAKAPVAAVAPRKRITLADLLPAQARAAVEAAAPIDHAARIARKREIERKKRRKEQEEELLLG